MENVMKMAGEYAAHAIWGVSSGEILVPIVGYLKADKTQLMQRLAMGSVEAMALGEKSISELQSDMLGAVFIKDGLVTLETGKTDALIVDVKFADDPNKRVQIILPYRNANHADGFAVHRPKMTDLEGISEDASAAIIDAFFDGVDSHEEGGKIWQEKYVDQAGVSIGSYGDENTEFSIDDLDVLKKSPLLIFLLVAASDGNVDKKEVTAFQEILYNAEKFNNPLLIRIITNVINDVSSIMMSMMQEEMDYIGELGKIKEIVERNLSPVEANDFKMTLFLIAEASGGFLGLGNKISEEERVALAAIALCLEIQPAE